MQNKLVYRNPLTGRYAFIELDTFEGKKAYWAVKDGGRSYFDTLEKADSYLTRAGYEKNGTPDSEDGTIRYTLPYDKLAQLYKDLEEFAADCTRAEYRENVNQFQAVFTMIHKHMNVERDKK